MRIYINKMFKIYQLNIIKKNKERLQKKLLKDNKIFLKKKKKRNNMVLNTTNLSEYEKNKLV